MLRLIILLILIQIPQNEKSLSPTDFIWNNRLLIVFGEYDSSEWFTERYQCDLSERKLLVIYFKNSGLAESNFKGDLKRTEFLKLLTKKDDQSVTWVLVGLDGGVKKSGFFNPQPNDIFRIIDAMPMRQSELIK